MAPSRFLAHRRLTGFSFFFLDDLDAELVEGDEDGVDLLGSKIDLLQHFVEVIGEKVTLLAPLREELLDLLDGQLARIVGAAGDWQVGHDSTGD